MTVTSFATAGAAHCARPWSDIEARAHGDEGELFNARTSCFSSALISAFLERAGAAGQEAAAGASGVSPDVYFANHAGGVSIEWALGALVLGAREGGPSGARSGLPRPMFA